MINASFCLFSHFFEEKPRVCISTAVKVSSNKLYIHSMNYTSFNKHGARFLADLTHTIIKSSEPEIITQSQPKICFNTFGLEPTTADHLCNVFNVQFLCSQRRSSFLSEVHPSMYIFITKNLYTKYHMHIANCPCKWQKPFYS